MGQVDLHLHSTASDGALAPAGLVRQAFASGLRFIALSDHDSVDGIPEAIATAKDLPGLTFIPAVEVSTDTSGGDVHILGYFLDYNDPVLTARLKGFRDSRRYRGEKMVAKLADLGIIIEWQRVQEIAGTGSIGRPHIAQAMIEKGYISNPREAFDKYIGHNGPAYVEREKMTPVEAVELVLRAHGLPVLAHPFTVNNPEEVVEQLVQAGLAGIEAYTWNTAPAQIEQYIGLASKYRLIITGGSDFHGLKELDEMPLGSLDVPLRAALDLLDLARAHNRLAES